MKILISGGHLTPALAFIDYAKKFERDEFVFVGRPYSQIESRQKSHEADEITQRGIKFISFSSGKFSHFGPLYVLQQYVHIIKAFFSARRIFGRERPNVFLSFGGYLAVPLTLAAFTMRVPIITHEQTRTAGLANRFIAFFAKAIAVTYPETAFLFPQKKTVVTGNPLRSQVFLTNPPQPSWISIPPKKPILYITGGSQGSQVINTVVGQVIHQLAIDWCIIHQCGYPNALMHYSRELERKRKMLDKDLQSSYYIREWVNETELAWIFGHTKAIVSRAGANTVHEITMAGKPAIFIPLPTSRGQEQLKNAQAVVNTGAALLLLQKDTDPENFLKTIHQLRRHYSSLLEKAQHNTQLWEKRADQKLYDLVYAVVQS